MHKFKTLTLLSFSALALVGCGNDHVDNVKNSYTGLDSTLNLEQILDHRKLCREVEWNEFEDDKGRSVVAYKCFLNGSQAYFESLKSTQLERADTYYENAIKSAKQTSDRQYGRIEYYTKEIEKYRAEKVKLEAKLAQVEAIEKERLDIYAKYKDLKVDGRHSATTWDKMKKDLELLDEKHPDIQLSNIHFYVGRQKSLLENNERSLQRAIDNLPDEADIEDRYSKSLAHAKV